MNYNEFKGGLSEALQAFGFDDDAYDATTGNFSPITAPSGEALAFTYDGSLVTSESMSEVIGGSVSLAYDIFTSLPRKKVYLTPLSKWWILY
jgi:hypothetical protein